MSKNKSPAFQYYPRDVLMNPIIAVMSNEEFGAYWKLVSFVWLERFLPNDEKHLANLLKISPNKFRRLWLAMEKLFRIDDDKITHPDLDELRQKQEEWREKSAEGSRKSAQVRAKGGSNLVEPNAKQTSTLHLHSASSSSTAHPHTPPQSVCMSDFSLEQCKIYAWHLHDTGQGIEKPRGYAKTIHRSGEDDVEMRAFFNGERAGGDNSAVMTLTDEQVAELAAKAKEKLSKGYEAKHIRPLMPDLSKADWERVETAMNA